MKTVFAILLAVSGLAFGQPSGSISGTVIESTSGAPIAGATVYITADSKRWRTESNSSGHYTLRDVPAGKYVVMSQRTGEGGQWQTKSVDLASSQQLDAVDFRLELSSALTGTVMDERKKPVAGANVWIIKREYQFGELRYFAAGRVGTNTSGQYSLAPGSITPGRGFLLYATTAPDVYKQPISDIPADPEQRKPSLIPMYYPNSTDVYGAQALTLRAGEVREHVDFVLRHEQSYCLSATLLANGSPAVIPYWVRNQSTRNGGGTWILLPMSKSDAEGKIRICDLHPGEYEMTTSPLGLRGTRKITITNRDADRIVVDAIPGIGIRGMAKWAGDTLPAGFGGLSILIESPAEMQKATAKLRIDGSLMFPELQTGEFDVQVSGIPKGCYVKDVTYGGRSVLHDTFQAEGNSEFEVVLGRDAGFVSAKVADRNAKPIPAATVVVFPASATTEAEIADSMVSGVTDSNGVFASRELAPGKYYVLACDLKIARSPEVMGKLFAARSRAEVRDLAPNSAVQLTLELLNLD